MCLFKGASEKEIKSIILHSARDLHVESACAFIISDCGSCFGIYYNEIMECYFNNFTYRTKPENSVNLFFNRLYRISNFTYRFYNNLEFKCKLDFEEYIKKNKFLMKIHNENF
jgi:bacterioferritin-associated ferredoxin